MIVKILKSCNVCFRTNHTAWTHYGNEALNAFKCGQFVSASHRRGAGLTASKNQIEARVEALLRFEGRGG